MILSQIGPDTTLAKRWRWIWEESCSSMAPYLAPRMGVKLEDWPEYVDSHIRDMVASNGKLHILRTVARKPLTQPKK